ncbi:MULTISPECIES: forespore capture DNA-binding protein RefZ [Aneurinibacillus]|uniref:Putative HTH-type transcriptional regulator YttP n=1 Tax=Aneurinibacillus danicus TaxID=267746 RepID=A0A511V4Z7_9BACL|nr:MULTISPECIES: forespore capture DNA-binding protein RefZ [Aneurinibacillus]GEN33171.1 putative HTH-type transcriptional regulator YttP [Aneurinibacillus danicus]
MKRSPKLTKQKIIRAAVELFDSQGFDGTTVRQIACKADVNVALISYYFKNKKGLLEHMMIDYYENMFHRLDACRYDGDWHSLSDLLHSMVESLVRFQCDSYQVTRLIQRELSVESMLGREVMSTYLARLKHYFTAIIEEGIAEGEFPALQVDGVVIQLMAITSFPYTYPQIIREVFYLEPLDDGFVEEMVRYISDFLRHMLTPLNTLR